MTNDGFPDHMPMPEPCKWLTGLGASERIKGILEASGVRCIITGRISARFPDGAYCEYENCIIEANGLSHQRG